MTANASHNPSKKPSPKEMSELIALFNQGQYAEVVSKSKALLGRFPQSGDCYKTLGVALRQLGDREAASAAMLQAAKLLPNDPVAHYNLAVVLRQQEKFAAAEPSYKRVLELDPIFVPARLGLGQVLKMQKRFQEAEICYRQALKIKPDSKEAFNALAEIFTEQGDWLSGLRLANQYLLVDQSSQAKSLFVRCLTRANPKQVNGETLEISCLP